jgi:hypothetical protein
MVRTKTSGKGLLLALGTCAAFIAGAVFVANAVGRVEVDEQLPGSSSVCIDSTVPADAATIEEAVREAKPGAVLCIAPGNVEGNVALEFAGAKNQRIEVSAQGTRVGSLSVSGEFGTVQGFEVTGGSGIEVEASNVAILNNIVSDTTADGIRCVAGIPGCTDVLIKANRVSRADGTGILIRGMRVTVEDNIVSDSLRKTAGDADGIRFFGIGHTIVHNTIFGIHDRGYGADGPHTDCFQSFDSGGKGVTADVVIDGNLCTDVDHQCLIIEAEDAAAIQSASMFRNIRFVNNICRTNGSQPILIRDFSDVLIANNLFDAPKSFRSIFLEHSGQGIVVANNIVMGDKPIYSTDKSSRGKIKLQANIAQKGRALPGLKIADPMLAGGSEGAGAIPLPGSPMLDAGVEIAGLNTDFLGRSRPSASEKGSQSRTDVGPIEGTSGSENGNDRKTPSVPSTSVLSNAGKT